VRERSEPYLMEMNTTRLSWHKQGQPDSRSKDEVADVGETRPAPIRGAKAGSLERTERALPRRRSRLKFRRAWTPRGSRPFPSMASIAARPEPGRIKDNSSRTSCVRMAAAWGRKVKVLVAGGQVFIGSHLVARLSAEGAEVKASLTENSR